MGSRTVIKNIEKAVKSKSIKAIILRIDSPGGSATASEAIWHAIQNAREKKPVIASVADYGASGGYYISMAADTMLTTPNSLVGSIGIYAGKFNIMGLYDKLEIKTETVSAGKNGGLFSLTKPWSKSERQIMERMIADFYKDFVEKTAQARNMTFDEVDKLAQGHVWTGTEAVENGLFDGTGYFYSAVDAAVQMAKIDSSESVRLVYYPQEKSMFDELLRPGLFWVVVWALLPIPWTTLQKFPPAKFLSIQNRQWKGIRVSWYSEHIREFQLSQFRDGPTITRAIPFRMLLLSSGLCRPWVLRL